MSSSPLLQLEGAFEGMSRLWMVPGDPPRDSLTTALLAPAAQGRFLSLAYTWSEGGQPQDGLIVISADPERPTCTATWVDSWHMGDTMMHCTGTLAPDGVVSVLGHYAAPPGPDWGWRITLTPESDAAFVLRMFNITPDGAEMLAVEAPYTRRRSCPPPPSDTLGARS